MPSKSKKHSSRAGKEQHQQHQQQTQQSANNSGISGQRKEKKQRNIRRNDARKDHSPIKSIKKSIRNKFHKIKSSNSGKKQQGGDMSVVSSVVSSELDNDMVFHPPRVSRTIWSSSHHQGSLGEANDASPALVVETRQPPATRISNIVTKSPAASLRRSSTPQKNRSSTPQKSRRSITPQKMRSNTPQKNRRSRTPQKSRRSSTPQKSTEAPKPMEKRESPLSKFKPTEKTKRKQQKQQPSMQQQQTIESDPVLSYEHYDMEMKSDRKKKKGSKKAERQKQQHHSEFRSFLDSSDYSDTDFESYKSEAEESSTHYSDPGYAPISYNDSESGSESESDSSHSESSVSYTTTGETTEGGSVTIRTQRGASTRNPEDQRSRRGRSRNPRRQEPAHVVATLSPASASSHIRSPRTSPLKNSSQHISSPRRGGNNKGFFRDGDVTNTDDSSYATGTSFDDDDSCQSDSDASNSSGSSYSDSEGVSDSNDEYYTTSYDTDPRNLRNNSSFSSSWADRPISTYGSSETDRTDLTNKKPREYSYPTLLDGPNSCSTDDTRTQHCESRSTTNDSNEYLGSIDEIEYDDFVKEQEAEEKAVKDRVVKKEIEDIKKPKVQQDNGGSVFSWIFGKGSTVETGPALEPEIPKIGDKEDGEVHTEEIKTMDDDHALDPKSEIEQNVSSSRHSPRTARRFPRSPISAIPPRSALSPRSAASSRNDFIVRDRRGAISLDNDVKDRPVEFDPTMSPGCSVNLKQIRDGGDSMPGSYDGLKDGEFLLSNNETGSTNTKGKIGEVLSLTMRGSGTLENDGEEEEDSSKHIRENDAPTEIAFSPLSVTSVMTSPTTSRKVEPLMIDAEREVENPFLYLCCSPNNSITEDNLPSYLPLSGMVEKEFDPIVATKNDALAYNANDDAISALVDEEEDSDADDTTCASTINTDVFNDLKDTRTVDPPSTSEIKCEEAEGNFDEEVEGNFEEEVEGNFEEEDEGNFEEEEKGKSEEEESKSEVKEKSVQYFMVPVNTEDEKNKNNEVFSCDEKIEIELGSYTYDNPSTSFDDVNTELEDKGSTKRITAECLDNCASSEVVHGRRAFQSKTDEDGVLIPICTTPKERRERRKKALKAHRAFLYKSRSIDTDTLKDCTDDTCETSESVRAIPTGGNTSTEGTSVLSNSIVQENTAIPNDADKPDALIELVRNALTVMVSPIFDGVSDPVAPVNNNGAKNEGGSKTTPITGPMDDMFEVAFRFFSPKEEAPLITETLKGQKETLMITNFNPNPGTRHTTPKKGTNFSFADSKKSSSSDVTNRFDEAVERHSRSNMSTHKSPDSGMNSNRFNADGIPLELRPDKIWRAFDSGFKASPAVVKGDTEFNAPADPKSNRRNQEAEQTGGTVSNRADTKNEGNDMAPEQQAFAFSNQKSESPSLRIDIDALNARDTSGSRLLSTSPRYKRRTDMRRMQLKNQGLYEEKYPMELVSKNNGGGPEHLPSLQQRFGRSEDERRQSSESLVKLNSEQQQPWPRIKVDERRDATSIDASHDPTFDEAPPSPIKTPPEDTIAGVRASPVVSPATHPNDASQNKNISDIRSRIKQRQRSKFQMQQQQYNAAEKARRADAKAKIIHLRTPVRASSSKKTKTKTKTKKTVRATTDRRDDTFSSSAKDDVVGSDEFYDAIPFDDNGGVETSKKGIKMIMVPTKFMEDRNRVYPSLSHKDSIMSGAMSLD